MSSIYKLQARLLPAVTEQPASTSEPGNKATGEVWISGVGTGLIQNTVWHLVCLRAAFPKKAMESHECGSQGSF